MNGETAAQHTVSTLHVDNHTSLNTRCLPLRTNETQHLPWDNPNDIVSQEAVAYVDQFKDITLALFVLIGGPANVINMAVFYKQGLKDRVNLCLFMLAMSDEVYLISSFVLYSENIYAHLTGQPIKTAGNKFMADNNLIFLLGAAFVSFILCGIIACERCYCVLRPMKYQTLLSTRTMAIIIFAIFACVFSLRYVLAHQYRMSCVYDPITGKVMMMMTGDAFYMTHKELFVILDSFILGAGFQGSIIIMTVAATITTIVKLRQIVMWRTKTSSSLSAREIVLTKMLVGNSVFFIVCISPGFLSRIASFIFPEMKPGGQLHNFYLFTLWLMQIFAYANSSFNFFIYFVMGSRYRETFYALFSCKSCRRRGSH